MIIQIFWFLAMNYCFGFIATKSYYNLEKYLSLPGASLFYAGTGVVGWVLLMKHLAQIESWIFMNSVFYSLILMYFLLPETENRTLEDIEIHFSDNQRKMTDRKIQKSSKNAATPNDDTKDSDQKVEQTKSSDSVDQENEKSSKSKSGYANQGFVADSWFLALFSFRIFLCFTTF